MDGSTTTEEDLVSSASINYLKARINHFKGQIKPEMDGDVSFVNNLVRGINYLVSYVRRDAIGGEIYDLARISKLPVMLNSDTNKAKPLQRSGHRIFVDRDFLYVVGGYVKFDQEQSILREVWRYNLLTQVWSEVAIDGDLFPTALASFSMAQTACNCAQTMTFGGTAFPFGETSSKDVHVITIDDDLEMTNTALLKVEGYKEPTYGQAMCRSTTDPETYYVVGGTTGHEFFLDVHELKRHGDGKWRWKQLSHNAYNQEGLYRLEIVHDGDRLIFIGGGTPDMVRGFLSLTVFNLVTCEYELLHTLPCENSEDGWPAARKCHAIVRWGRRVVMSGGCYDDRTEENIDIRNGVNICDDVWSLDLDSFRWSRHPHKLQTPVFFHDATVTHEGEMIIWGGVTERTSKFRSADGQVMWLDPPTLRTFATKAVRNYFSPYFQKHHKELRLSGSMAIAEWILSIVKEGSEAKAVPA